MNCPVSYREYDGLLSSWRLASGIEVDFVLGEMDLAVEAKSSAKVTRDHLKGFRTLAEDHARIKRRIAVCREPRPPKTADGFEILPVQTFIKSLWDGELIAG